MHKRKAGHSSGVGGFRPDLGIYVRSRWEANYARILNYLGKTFTYELQPFLVTLSDDTESSYCPDFFVDGEFVEIKGYWRPKRREKERMEAFRNQYPEHSLRVIGPEQYYKLSKQFAPLINEWEHNGDPPPSRPRRECEVCGGIVHSPSIKARYCSRRCAGIAKRTPGSKHSQPERW